MKHRGTQFKTISRDAAKIPRPGTEPISIWLKAMPLGHEEKAEELFPSPVCPTEYARDRKNRLIKDPETGKFVTEEVPDEKYKQAAKIATRRQMMVMFEAALDDPDWTFDTPKSEGAEYYDALYEEFKAAGFSAGDLMIIFKKILEVSNLGEEALEAARDALIEGKRPA